ncbi:MAG: hypothetical protein ACOC80_06725 [Petrotogales bacterium]
MIAEEKIKPKKRKKTQYYSIAFLVSVIIFYIILYPIHPQTTLNSLYISCQMLVNILPILFLVIIFMGLTNYLLKPTAIAKHLGKRSGAKGWFVATFMGILSEGPYLHMVSSPKRHTHKRNENRFNGSFSTIEL